MGGVAYLSLEDNEVRWEDSVLIHVPFFFSFFFPGAVRGWYQVPRHAPHETLPGYGAAVWR